MAESACERAGASSVTLQVSKQAIAIYSINTKKIQPRWRIPNHNIFSVIGIDFLFVLLSHLR